MFNWKSKTKLINCGLIFNDNSCILSRKMYKSYYQIKFLLVIRSNSLYDPSYDQVYSFLSILHKKVQRVVIMNFQDHFLNLTSLYSITTSLHTNNNLCVLTLFFKLLWSILTSVIFINYLIFIWAQKEIRLLD